MINRTGDGLRLLHVQMKNLHHYPWIYPFSAIVGHKDLKTALLISAVTPHIGGVLIQGEKGTGKSTSVRALASILPEIEVVKDCPFGCNPKTPENLCTLCKEKIRKYGDLPTEMRPTPLVTLPLGATEDRIIGSLDIEHTIKYGKKAFQVGILGIANRGILYVDEINLLPSHIVNLLIDVSSSGWNRVEREGISITHPARFTLIGTMNPEEGEINPHLRDRFGLVIKIQATKNIYDRIKILKYTLSFQNQPERFINKFITREKALKKKIIQARYLYKKITAEPNIIKSVANKQLVKCIEGDRHGFYLITAAKAYAALKGDAEIKTEHIHRVFQWSITNKIRDYISTPDQNIFFDTSSTLPPIVSDSPHTSPVIDKVRPKDTFTKGKESKITLGEPAKRIYPIGDTFSLHFTTSRREKGSKLRQGRRIFHTTRNNRGIYIKSSPVRLGRSLALDATLRAAAPFQKARPKKENMVFNIAPWDIHEKVRKEKHGRLIIFAVDASGSMGAHARMIATKGAILSMLHESYFKRDRVAMVVFHGNHAQILLEPTSSVEMAKKTLSELPTGGKTPLALGILKAYEVGIREIRKEPDLTPLILILTDGKPNIPLISKDPVKDVKEVCKKIAKDKRFIMSFIDTDDGHSMEFGICRELAHITGGTYFLLDRLRSEYIVDIVGKVI